MVRYQVRPDAREENERLVRAVYDELAAASPGGIRYETVVLDDGLTFVHTAELEGGAELADLAAFREFRAGLDDRCDGAPVRAEVRRVGRYDGRTA